MTREELLETPLIHLKEGRLSTRAWNILNFAGIQTVEQLICYDAFQLRKFRNCGQKTISEIREFLRKYHLDLEVPSSQSVLQSLRIKIKLQEHIINQKSREIAYLKEIILQFQFGEENKNE